MSIVAYYCNQGPLLIKQKKCIYVLKKLGDVPEYLLNRIQKK